MKTLKLISALLVLFIIGSYLVLSFTVTRVPVGKVGVRLQEYAVFGTKGVVEQDFGPGWHRDLGPIDSWVFFDSTVQTLEMTRNPKRGSKLGQDDVQVRSVDGNPVSVDVTVKYRIMPGKAYKIFQNFGGEDGYKDIVRNESQNICMDVFGKMRTEDFYDPRVRREVSRKTLTQLQKSLADNYVEVIDLLVRNVQFGPEYEESIREKKLADQRAKVENSTQKAKVEEGKTLNIRAETARQVKIIGEEKAAALIRMRAETDRQIAKIRADAGKYATEKKADADLIAAKKSADGLLLVKQAEAKGEELRNQAMMGAGGSIIVALEAAKNLNFEEVTISTVDTDLLDIDEMTTKLGVPAK